MAESYTIPQGIQNGSDLMVFATIDGVKKSIAYATNHSVSISAETTEISTKTKDNPKGAWQTSKITSYSWSMSTENLYGIGDNKGHGINELMKAFKAGNPVHLDFTNKNIELPTATGYTPASAGAGISRP